MSAPVSTSARSSQLTRRLGFWSAMGLVVGITIGSGIFRTPAVVASRVPDPTLMMTVWLLGGLISLCGALSVAELAATLPQTGGWYVFLRESWGRLAGFLFGWSELVLIRASAVGALATVFSEYLLRSIGVTPEPGSQLVNYVAAASIAVTTVINIRGVQLGAAIAGASTLAKFGGLAILVLASVILAPAPAPAIAAATPVSAIDPKLFGLALISALYAYDGFADVAFSAGEINEPGRTLPRAIVGGTLAIIAIYLAANGAYLYVNGIDRMSHSTLVAADTMQTLVGPIGTAFISVVVMLSTLGTLTGIMLTAPRIFYAMANDGLLFKPLARVHPRYHTPYVAIALAAALGIVFVLTRSFEQLSDTFVLSIWPFYGLAVAGLYRLRRTRPSLPRPYRVPAYPVLPAIFIAGVVYLVGNAIVADPRWTSVTFGIVLAGIPVYFFAFSSRTRQTS
ncbi:MAG TPA: amino acid permease [Vicinamibacterales bacterium]|nr:amino acid permease [Vicinamibacterales bacterium]